MNPIYLFLNFFLASPNKVPPVYKYLKDMELIHEIVINNDFEMKKMDSSDKRFVNILFLMSLLQHCQDVLFSFFKS